MGWVGTCGAARGPCHCHPGALTGGLGWGWGPCLQSVSSWPSAQGGAGGQCRCQSGSWHPGGRLALSCPLRTLLPSPSCYASLQTPPRAFVERFWWLGGCFIVVLPSTFSWATRPLNFNPTLNTSRDRQRNSTVNQQWNACPLILITTHYYTTHAHTCIHWYSSNLISEVGLPAQSLLIASWSKAKVNSLCNVCIYLPRKTPSFLHFCTLCGFQLCCLWLHAFWNKWHGLWICNQISGAQKHTNTNGEIQYYRTTDVQDPEARLRRYGNQVDLKTKQESREQTCYFNLSCSLRLLFTFCCNRITLLLYQWQTAIHPS